MVAWIPSGIALVSLAIWLVLRFGRGDFWRVDLPPRVSQVEQQVESPLASQPSAQLGARADGTTWPAVVAVVPARNEADVIARAVQSLLAQDYPGPLSVFVVDDHSDDGTAAVAQAAAASMQQANAAGEAAPRTSPSHAPHVLHVVGAEALPPGWSGKVWAQSQGVAAAARQSPEAAWVWLTDADIVHPPHALRELVSRGEKEQRDMLSLMVRLRCDSLAERLLIPAFVFFFAKLYPFSWIAHARKRTAGAAGGCILVRAEALRRIGGMAAIRGALIDDCSLAAQLKQHGSIRLDLADEAWSIRPYDGWGDIWRMIARTAYTQLHYSPWMLAGATLGMALTYLAPPVLTIAGLLTGAYWTIPAALAWVIMMLSYRPMLRYYKQPEVAAVLLPLVAAFYLLATLDSARRHAQGRGGEWKGRAQANSVLSAQGSRRPDDK